MLNNSMWRTVNLRIQTPRILHLHYSVLRATTGSMRVARRAGA